ncbi:MAG: RIP metalloprotease RseP, partial [candidate division Zixibacteria bacterium]|nr:RIP metalloprotease RseP [candidate division Zixibacteria bacterium]
ETLDDTGKKITKGILGVRPEVEYKQWSLLGAAGRGLTESVDFVRKMVLFVRDLISFKISPKLIGGPVFIVQVAGQTAEMGWSALLYFMAFLSVNLTVINLLPIPILDGGHILFLIVEKIKGSPMTIGQRTAALKIGLVFLLLVIVMVTYNDIMRFITG